MELVPAPVVPGRKRGKIPGSTHPQSPMVVSERQPQPVLPPGHAPDKFHFTPSSLIMRSGPTQAKGNIHPVE